MRKKLFRQAVKALFKVRLEKEGRWFLRLYAHKWSGAPTSFIDYLVWEWELRIRGWLSPGRPLRTLGECREVVDEMREAGKLGPISPRIVLVGPEEDIQGKAVVSSFPPLIGVSLPTSEHILLHEVAHLITPCIEDIFVQTPDEIVHGEEFRSSLSELWMSRGLLNLKKEG